MENAEVVIIGGGPAGACLATKLARRNIRTVLLERSDFPRFHIGESLLPASTKIFEDLGLYDRMCREFIYKPGGCWYYGDVGLFSNFGDCRKKASFSDKPHAFMVERDRFDKMMVENAAANGADVRTQQEVKDIVFEGDRVVRLDILDHAKGESYSIQPDMVFDCTGYHALLSRKLGIRHINNLKRMAVFAHYEGEIVEQRVKDGWFVGEMMYDGWIWLIRLSDTKISIGVVTSLEQYKNAENGKEQFLDDLIAQSPLAKRAFKETPRRVSDVHLYGNLGYHCERVHGANWALVGDSALFIDPCYSSGVHLALDLAAKMADHYLVAHGKGEAALQQELQAYETHLRKHEKAVTKLVESFYRASRSKWLRRIVPFLNARRELYLDFVELTGGDFLSNKTSTNVSWLIHVVISAILPKDKKPQWAAGDRPSRPTVASPAE